MGLVNVFRITGDNTMNDKARFTAHTYAGYWWIRDNQTGDAVTASNGRRLFYHVSALGMEGAMNRAKRKAAKLNNLEG
jgi:hypothetical protein